MVDHLCRTPIYDSIGDGKKESTEKQVQVLVCWHRRACAHFWTPQGCKFGDTCFDTHQQNGDDKSICGAIAKTPGYLGLHVATQDYREIELAMYHEDAWNSEDITEIQSNQ